jgi:ABC-type sulfate transport system substrate-binding protein
VRRRQRIDPERLLRSDARTVSGVQRAFCQVLEGKTGDDVSIKQSHGGSGKQARAVIDGLEADVVTLALAYDIDAIAQESKNKLLASDWQKRLPHNSSPYTSTIVFLVRKGNPKGIKDWDDLIKPGVEVITPNPKTSGGARWNYLAAWGYALKKYGSEAKAREYVKICCSTCRCSIPAPVARPTPSFSAVSAMSCWPGKTKPSCRSTNSVRTSLKSSFRRFPSWPNRRCPWSKGVVDKRGTTKVATAYLEYLYSAEGQEIAAKHYYRPRDAKIAAKYARQFGKVNLVTIDDTFGGWRNAQKTHFSDGGIFDQLYVPGGKR